MRPVVLKSVRKDRASDPDIRRKILEEARLASAIQHPNYVPGRTLQDLLASGALNVHFALSIGIQIASGLADAHQLKILHRDLKPANIMITDGGLVKILDFGQVAEEYLKARALLSRFLWSSSNREDLEQAKEAFESVLSGAPQFASAHAGLGMTHLHYVINGFGGLTHFMSAQRHLEKALEIDPDHIEARVNRAYTFVWRGEKENARRDIQYLLKHAGNDGEVLVSAGVIVQLDGLLEESLRLLGMALEANPAGAARVYNRRARIYHYMGQLDLAWHEVEQGLTTR